MWRCSDFAGVRFEELGLKRLFSGCGCLYLLIDVIVWLFCWSVDFEINLYIKKKLVKNSFFIEGLESRC